MHTARFPSPSWAGRTSSTAIRLNAVALALNSRPRKTLAWKTPGEALSEQLRLLTDSVATTP
uniref:hypothetical protein n=1 Tax=Streptomyces sp. NBC_01562 TaxID=2975879 RepID=UPI003BA854BC